jgi:hypothetical protein
LEGAAGNLGISPTHSNGLAAGPSSPEIRPQTAAFTREDAVEAAGAVVEPVLDNHHRALPHPLGSWGPMEADALIALPGRWHNPAPEPALSH